MISEIAFYTLGALALYAAYRIIKKQFKEKNMCASCPSNKCKK